MGRYLKLLTIFAKISLQRQIMHRASFILAIVGKSLRVCMVVVFWGVVFSVRPSLQGWDFDRALVFLAFYATIEAQLVITFHRNLFYYLPAMIRKGDFDALLTKPVPSLFYASFRLIDVMDLISAAVPLILWGIVFSRNILPFDLLTLITIFLFIIIGYLSLYGITVMLASSAFWFLTSTGTGRAFEGMLRLSRFPVDFLPQPFRILLTYVIPIGFIATVPAQWFFHLLHPVMILVGVGLAAGMLMLGMLAWKAGLRRYASASS